MHALLQNLTYRGLLSIINIVNNSFLLHQKNFFLPYTFKQSQLSIDHFNDKLISFGLLTTWYTVSLHETNQGFPSNLFKGTLTRDSLAVKIITFLAREILHIKTHILPMLCRDGSGLAVWGEGGGRGWIGGQVIGCIYI